MIKHRTVISIAGLLVGLALATLATLATPAFARSTTLLSGYGGPGQGNQAVLGATMLGGHGGGSSGGNGGGSSSGGSTSARGAGESPTLVLGREATARGGSAAGSTSSTSPTRGSTSSTASAHARRSRERASGAARPAAAGAARSSASVYPAAERIPSGASADALGLSAADIVLIILGAGIVVCVGVFTRRLGATDAQRGVNG